MPFSNFTQLVSSIQDTLNRADLTPVAPDFITLAETQLNRRLDTQDMITRNQAFSIAAQYTPLPADFLTMRSIRIISVSPTVKLQYRTPDQMADWMTLHCDTPGQPAYFTISGGSLEVERTPDTAYTAEISYYSKIPALTSLNPTNWLLQRHPDVYLYGALLQSAPYLKDDERIQVWQNLYQNIIQEIAADDEQAAYSGGTMAASISSIG
jgi:hypothetical protein